jgi:hypothetical protein
MSGSILLGAVADRTETIDIACGACERHGTLRTERLLADHGPAMEMPTLLRSLAGDCPKLAATNFYEKCDVHCPTLSALFMPIARLI